jgi:hypothetical protein
VNVLSADDVLRWMVDHSGQWRLLADEEHSRSVHEEFLNAESGRLPSPAERLERVGEMSMRAWLRLLARALDAQWGGSAGPMADRLDMWVMNAGERLEALTLEEGERLSRRGLSHDPAADRRALFLLAQARFFAEGVGNVLQHSEWTPPTLGVAVADHMRAHTGTAPAGEVSDGPTDDQTREIAASWAAVQDLVRALEYTLGGWGPEAA